MACGYYQLHQPYYTDCKQWGDSGRGPKINLAYEACSKDYGCSTNCTLNYLNRYTPGCAVTPRCEDYARVHNGGPKGCKSKNIFLFTFHYCIDLKIVQIN